MTESLRLDIDLIPSEALEALSGTINSGTVKLTEAGDDDQRLMSKIDVKD